MTTNPDSWFERLLNLSLSQAGCFVLLVLSVVVLVKFALLPLLKHFSLGNLIRALKLLLQEILGHHGKLGVLNVVAFVVLAILSFVVFQSESGGGIKSLLPSSDGVEGSVGKRTPYVFCLCLLLTVAELFFSLYLLYRVEQQKLLTKD